MLFSDFKISDNEAIYVQIENHIKDNINRGLLLKNSKLPSTRELSKFLGVSRNSIIIAYENLEAEGIIETLKGKGTYVALEKEKSNIDYKIKWNDYINDYSRTCNEMDILKTELPWKRGMISFKSIAPEEDLFDIEEVKRAFLNSISLEGNKLLNYGYAKGYKPLIDYLKVYMSGKGINMEGKDILITNGFTEAFDIVVSSLCNNGDSIVCENPTHNTAIKIMKAHKLNIVGVTMDEEGILIEKLDKALKENKPKLAYIIPSYHNPTGIVTKGTRREELLKVFEKYKVPIIEDGFNEELLYSSSHVPALASFASNSNGIIYLGSFSKILFPGLRLGWILADKSLVNSLESVKRARSIHSSFLDQALLYHYMESGSFYKYVKKVRNHYRKKYKYTVKEIKKYIPHEAIMGEGGLHVFIKLRDVNARNVLELCYKQGVLFTPGDIFYTDCKGENTLRIGFSRVSEEEITKGLKIIGEVVKNISSS